MGMLFEIQSLSPSCVRQPLNALRIRESVLITGLTGEPVQRPRVKYPSVQTSRSVNKNSFCFFSNHLSS